MGPGGMMRHHMERLAHQLELTDDQRMQVRTLFGNHSKEGIRLRADLGVMAVDLRQLLEADPVDLPESEATVAEHRRQRGRPALGPYHPDAGNQQAPDPGTAPEIPGLRESMMASWWYEGHDGLQWHEGAWRHEGSRAPRKVMGRWVGGQLSVGPGRCLSTTIRCCTNPCSLRIASPDSSGTGARLVGARARAKAGRAGRCPRLDLTSAC